MSWILGKLTDDAMHHGQWLTTSFLIISKKQCFIATIFTKDQRAVTFCLIDGKKNWYLGGCKAKWGGTEPEYHCERPAQPWNGGIFFFFFFNCWFL